MELIYWFLGILFYVLIFYWFWIIGKSLDNINDDLKKIRYRLSYSIFILDRLEIKIKPKKGVRR